ncbi:hypothetical protein EDB83DRAFT_2521235 [Lactarius deliciosus]|nr:hypothetical protein EDB83DRAFT_2521235 [Lactarius deliciosus]
MVSGKQMGDLRTVSPHLSSSDVPGGATDVDRIDWGNLSHEDKQDFFTWLDEFFAGYLDQPQPSVRVSPVGGPNTYAPPPRASPSLPPRRDSPQARFVAAWTYPQHLQIADTASPKLKTLSFWRFWFMSFPPLSENGSAVDLAWYMHPSTSWDTDWYASNSPIPLHLNGSPEIRFASAFGLD